MSPQEREQLIQFLRQLTQAPAVQKDAEADTLIREACARQPEAPYLLVQRALLMDQALQQAQAQITRLQGELDQARSTPRSGGFLDNNAWGNGPARPASTLGAPVQGFQAAPPVGAPGGTWGSGWLGNVATTAAGVVAGSFLFQGIEHLLGSHHSGNSLFGGSDSPLSQGLTESTVVNNYHGSESSSSTDFDATALDISRPLDDDSSDNGPDWI